MSVFVLPRRLSLARAVVCVAFALRCVALRGEERREEAGGGVVELGLKPIKRYQQTYVCTLLCVIRTISVKY